MEIKRIKASCFCPVMYFTCFSYIAEKIENLWTN